MQRRSCKQRSAAELRCNRGVGVASEQRSCEQRAAELRCNKAQRSCDATKRSGVAMQPRRNEQTERGVVATHTRSTVTSCSYSLSHPISHSLSHSTLTHIPPTSHLASLGAPSHLPPRFARRSVLGARRRSVLGSSALYKQITPHPQRDEHTWKACAGGNAWHHAGRAPPWGQK